MTRLLLALAAVAISGTACGPSLGETRQLVSRDIYLMGTRASLATYATERRAGLAALESAVQVLQEVDRELSTWREDSDVARLNRHPMGSPWVLDSRLCQMFEDVFHWHNATAGAFDPAIGRLLEAWNVYGRGAVPTPDVLARARKSSGLGAISFDRQRCTLTRSADVTLDVGAFGKGEALDRVRVALGPTPWMIDLGGQISVGGAPPPEGSWQIAIAHPIERDVGFVQVRMTDGSLSTSAGSERDLRVGTTRVGHILDPRTGRPAPFEGSVTVWHRSALAADALSTALYIMGPDEGLRWAQERDLAVCYLIMEADDVRVLTSRRFQHLFGPL